MNNNLKAIIAFLLFSFIGASGYSNGNKHYKAGTSYIGKTKVVATPKKPSRPNCSSLNKTWAINRHSAGGGLSEISISLWKQPVAKDTVYIKTDQAALVFDTSFSNTYGPQDAVKIDNPTDNLSILDGGISYSIDGRKPPTAKDTLQVLLTQIVSTNYELQFDATSFVPGSLTAYIHDAYKKTNTPLKLALNVITFTTIDSVDATFENRFSIIFKQTPLPIKSVSLAASLEKNVASLRWNTIGEVGVEGYSVEKSVDGNVFANIAEVKAMNTQTASYSIEDKNVDVGNNYYRVKAIGNDGSFVYSNVAAVSNKPAEANFTLYPNPLKGNTLNILFDNSIAGKYNVSLYNSLGQQVFVGIITHDGAKQPHSLTLNKKMAAGIYRVAISSNSNIIYQGNISVQ